ncbi:hypothetical protein ACTMTI_23795 [Nonomuraea sp. H19]|uniref:hypothetical protein n=1 Tax=Nonomuraea sp. H19 TaxID=3452206 RepID=UPI003F894335
MAGLLPYVNAAVSHRCADVELIWWAPPANQPLEARSSWVYEQVTPVVEKLQAPLLIGKSLGSYGAAVAADRGLPGVWLTPLLTMPACAVALRRATAPFLLVGGATDDLWDGTLARELTPHVLEVDGADHGMQVAGPLRETAEVLGQVMTAVEAFLDDVVWR